MNVARRTLRAQVLRELVYVASKSEVRTEGERTHEGFPKFGVVFWGVPIRRIIVSWGLFGSFPKQGDPNVDPKVL